MRKICATLLALIVTVAGFGSASQDPLPEWSTFVAKEGNRWAIHRSDHGTLVALYGQSRTTSGSPGEAASHFLRQYSGMLGVRDASTLRLEQQEQSLLGTHYRYGQYYGNLPVVSADVNVHVNQRNQVIAANSQYHALQGTAKPAMRSTEARICLSLDFGSQERTSPRVERRASLRSGYRSGNNTRNL